MIENKYIQNKLIEKEYSNNFLKLEDIISSCINTIQFESNFKHADILRAIKIINTFCKELNIEIISKEETMNNLDTNKMYNLLLNKLNDILQIEHNNSYDEILGITKINKIEESDFNKINNSLFELKEIVQNSDLENELKEKLVKDIEYIITNLKNDEKEINKTRGLLVGVVEKVDGAIIDETEEKGKIKNMLGEVFQYCGNAIKNIKPDNINISLININNKNEISNDNDIIDITPED